jgi:hypothetical protein
MLYTNASNFEPFNCYVLRTVWHNFKGRSERSERGIYLKHTLLLLRSLRSLRPLKYSGVKIAP